MRVRMKQHITGTRNGIEWPEVGGDKHLPAHEAADLIAQGYAEPAAVPSAGTSPTDVVPDGKIDVVLAWVDGNHETARIALDYELSQAKPRKGLLAQLEEIAAQGGDDETTPTDPGSGGPAAAGSDGPPADPADAAAADGSDSPAAGDEASSRDW